MITISDIKNKYGISMALVILCTRVYFKTAEIDDLNTFIASNDIEWSDVFKTCRKHRIRSFIYRVLLKIEIPEKIRLEINIELKRNSVQNIKLALETEKLINILNQQGIKILPYKGAAYSKQFFGNINMRESSDIDLILNPDDLSKIFPIMKELGFQSYQLEYYHRIGHKKFIKTHKDFNFDKFLGEKIEFHVEFHFNIINKNLHVNKKLNYFDWNNPQENQLINKKIHFINPIEHFKAVCMHHLLQDQLGHLKTIIDLTQGMNWVENYQIQNNNENNNSETFTLLNKNLNTNIVKATINQLLATQFKNKLVEKKKIDILIHFILSNNYQKMRNNKFPIWDAIKYHYSIITRTKEFYITLEDKFFYLYNQILSTFKPQAVDYMIIKINKPFHFLYYIARPIRLLFLPQDPQSATKNKI
ncbi:Uncharacterised nucleotidyltransferase [Flavobacterium glycines]|uniref:Uncharacterized nucleotidyltransferase n=1 Tax=Flavobacterium glycines TaxID=551990 RepID=A0A1B9DNV4_9FLAO|nr:nucleotidyltransferase family protein [Flavobacterium glycines]OCB71382.1 hypothetical protein FBGL_09055 [Flavobacterium glycines]GEL10400.1 hypothetical protein FGL01_11390 [Flavobacterium glycines]SDI69646.1 Uncharacterised nucleotidyltransferase [Flavobacterium glycines]